MFGFEYQVLPYFYIATSCINLEYVKWLKFQVGPFLNRLLGVSKYDWV